MNSPSTAPADGRRLRAALGSFGSGVVIATTDGPHGLTCQAFCSLSLEPALFGLSVRRSSRVLAAIVETRRLCINVLSADQADLAQRFAQSGIDRFAGIPWQRSPLLGLPTLPGTVATVEGTINTVHEAGDHLFLVADIAHATHSDREPLLYLRSDYHRPASRVPR